MGSLPQAIFIIDPARELIAVAEARKLEVPIVAITDSNCNPDVIAHPIPGKDDAIRAIRLVTSVIADACLHGTARRRDTLAGRERDGQGRPGSDTVVYQSRGRHGG